MAEPEVGPRLTDEQFLRGSHGSALADVKAAVARADWTAANTRLQHLRGAATPPLTFIRSAGPTGVSVQGPRRALQRRLSSIGMRRLRDHRLGTTPLQADSKWPRNRSDVGVSRHPMWQDLGRAFYATGDEKYAVEFVAQLKSWVQACPVPVKKPDNRPFSRWRTIEAGIRAGGVWPDVYHLFLSARAFDDEALTLFLKSYVEHAEYLMAFKTTGNWLTMRRWQYQRALCPEFGRRAVAPPRWND